MEASLNWEELSSQGRLLMTTKSRVYGSEASRWRCKRPLPCIVDHSLFEAF